MPELSPQSEKNLFTTHEDIQKVFRIAIQFFDFTVVYGNRPKSEQFELYKKGRKEVNGSWVVVDKKAVVTEKDGFIKPSTHNFEPSKAIDAIPYPIDWNDTNRMRYFAGFVVGIAEYLFSIGEIQHRIRWGGDWDRDTDLKDQSFNDLVHFEIY